MSLHHEKAFEDEITAHLTTHGGWTLATSGYDKADALIGDSVVGFIEAVYPKDWQKVQKLRGEGARGEVVKALRLAVEQHGTLHVLREGFKVLGRDIKRMVAWPPANDDNPNIAVHYAANRFEVMRQVAPGETGESVDMVLFVNGLPVVTLELKAPMAGQTWRDAVTQYQKRKGSLPLFRFGRAVVHFAVDTEAVAMTTRLAGKETRFLPFNRGDEGGGGGNPVVEGKAKTSYLWEDVLAVGSLVELVQRFAFVERGAGKRKGSGRLIFPRYHQRDAVRFLVGEALAKGAGHNWLVQHSAGSGKSNTIGWLAHRLASLHGADGKKVYDKVVVLSDRRVLDRQLGATLSGLADDPGLVVTTRSSAKALGAALAGAAPIVVSTIHRFGYVHGAAAKGPARRYAVIVDEAHSSQSGEMARDVKSVLAGSALEAAAAEEVASMDDAVTEPGQAALVAALSRRRLPNLSYFAFTATPKAKTLELFGGKGADGKPVAHHLYSMRQAIEEGFILDVLKGYATYKRYYQLVRAGDEDREVPPGKARRALARFVDLHETNISQKVEVIVEHFMGVVAGRIGGLAKAMVVCGSRLQAVRYYRAIKAYAGDKGYALGCLVAFTGSVADPLVEGEVTEAGLNGFSESRLPGEFEKPAWRMLVVADKYQTGFDAPLLHTMYVDKRLSGITAVQTLSRLNRCHPGKEDTRVLDFKNEMEEIKASFQPYYEGTTTAELVDLGRVDVLEGELDGSGVYTAAEVEAFWEVFYGLADGVEPLTHGALSATLAPAKGRFLALRAGPDDTEGRAAQDAFRSKLGAYVRLYGFVAQLRDYPDPKQEKLYAFGRLLLRLIREEAEGFSLGDEVDLKWLKVRPGVVGSIGLESGQVGQVRGPMETGSGSGEEGSELLSKVLDMINERFGKAGAAMVEEVIAEAEGSAKLEASAAVNSVAHFEADAVEVVKGSLDVHYAEAVAAQQSQAKFIEAFYREEELRALVLGAIMERLGRSFSVGAARVG